MVSGCAATLPSTSSAVEAELSDPAASRKRKMSTSISTGAVMVGKSFAGGVGALLSSSSSAIKSRPAASIPSTSHAGSSRQQATQATRNNPTKVQPKGTVQYSVKINQNNNSKN